MEQIERQFLIAASLVQLNEGKSMVGLDEVATQLDAPIMDVDERDAFARIAHSLGMRGFLKDAAPSKQSSWMLFSITQKGMDELEGRNQPSSGDTTINISDSNVSGSIIGARDNAQLTNNYDFHELQKKIDQRGGNDREELTEFRVELEDAITNGEKLDRGIFARFAEVMRRNQWIVQLIAPVLAGFITQQM